MEPTNNVHANGQTSEMDTSHDCLPTPPSSTEGNDVKNSLDKDGLQLERGTNIEASPNAGIEPTSKDDSQPGLSSLMEEQPSTQIEHKDLDPGSLDSVVESKNASLANQKVNKKDEDEDDEEILAMEINDANQYPEDLDPLEDRVKKAPKRVLQHLWYTRLMEDRMTDMERRLVEVENKGKEPEPAPVISKTSHEDLILALNRIGWQEYKPKETDLETRKEVMMGVEHKRHHEFSRQSQYIIDVVMSDVWLSESQGKEENPRSAILSLSKDEFGTESSHVPSLKDRPQPERIRINSSLLLQALEKITDQTFTKSRVHEDLELMSQVFLRPFKLFVVYEKEIRDFAARLKQRLIPEGSRRAPDGIAESKNNTAVPMVSRPKDPGFEGLLLGTPTYTTPEKVADRDALESRRCLEELLNLIKLFDIDLKPTFELRKRIEERSVRDIAFQDLWHLFRLGDVIQSADTSCPQTYRILNVTGGKPFLCNRNEMPGLEPVEGRDVPYFILMCFFYSTDGSDAGAQEQSFYIKWYDGVRAITSLDIYPIAFSRIVHDTSVRQHLVDRGRRTLELAKTTDVVQHKMYNGMTMTTEIQEEVNSEVIIDLQLYSRQFNRGLRWGVTGPLTPDPRETREFLDSKCKREGCCQNTPIHQDGDLDTQKSTRLQTDKGFVREVFDLKTDVQDEDLVICQCWVEGYVLRSRKWINLDVTLVKDIQDRQDGFNSLVLPEGHRETLLALVKTHSNSRMLYRGLQKEGKEMDLVRGKGKGLIILLHGEPGVGKTSTAECVAEFTRRPLFQVTCGDIGETADQVEIRLEEIFKLAHKWGCVLLLDEADVFLEARSKTDLRRNAIVSVFLRVLEYYSGILFLTTNRVGAFDQAFRSRIHMSLFYPKIQQDSTEKIWKMNLKRAKEIWRDSLTIKDEDSDEIMQFAKEHYHQLATSRSTWNGRQIRNAFQTAIALAEWDAQIVREEHEDSGHVKPRLRRKHFERVADASKHFDQYVKVTVGTDADVARERSERRDDLFPGDIDEQIKEQRNSRVMSPLTPRGTRN